MAVAKKRPYTRRNNAHTPVPAVKQPATKADMSNPVSMRNRIAEIDAIAAELHKERVLLENKITELGFKMTVTLRSPDDWKTGDVVRCINEDVHAITKNKPYIIADEPNERDEIQIQDDDGDYVHIPSNNFEFVTR